VLGVLVLVPGGPFDSAPDNQHDDVPYLVLPGREGNEALCRTGPASQAPGLALGGFFRRLAGPDSDPRTSALTRPPSCPQRSSIAAVCRCRLRLTCTRS